MTSQTPSIAELLDTLLQRAKEEQRVWEETEVRLAVIGNSGTGKSSLINAIVGERVAATGPTEQTSTVESFEHRGITICDLPGCGTEREPAEDYVERHRLDTFDLHVLVVANRVYEGDLSLAQELSNDLGKRPFVVRSMIDQVVANAVFDGLSEAEALERTRADLQRQLQQHARSLHLVSARPPQYELPALQLELSNALDSAKRDRFLADVGATSDALIDEKVRIAETVAGRYALMAAANGLNPLPGMDVSVDLALVRKAVDDIRAIFDLDEKSLKYYATVLGQPLDAESVGAIGAVARRLAIYGGEALAKQIAKRLAMKGGSKLLPFIGPVIGAGLGYKLMHDFLAGLVDDCATQARVLARELAARSI